MHVDHISAKGSTQRTIQRTCQKGFHWLPTPKENVPVLYGKQQTLSYRQTKSCPMTGSI